MTAKQLFENALIELSKVKAPSLLLEDFNYLINKAIYQYVNKRYNLYDTTQQTTDDLRVLKSTALLEPSKTDLYKNIEQTGSSLLSEYKQSVSNLYGSTYEINLPYDYYHMLNCICIYKVNKKHKCYPAGSYIQFSATKLDSDKWSQIINDYYNRPTPQRPYYFLHNVNQNNGEYTNPYNCSNQKEGEYYSHYSKGTDQSIDGVTLNEDQLQIWQTNIGFKFKFNQKDRSGKFLNERINQIYTLSSGEDFVVKIINNEKFITKRDNYLVFNKNTNDLYILEEGTLPDNVEKVKLTYLDSESSFDRSITLSAAETSSKTIQFVDLIDKPAGNRHANQSNVRCEIRYGKDDSIFQLVGVSVDYIKAPQYVELTPEQMDLTEDTSQILEFPDYVCQEIINELVHVIMENTADPRLQTHSIVSQSIASPTQQQTSQPAVQQTAQ